MITPEPPRTPLPGRAYPPFAALRAFDAVVSLGGIRAAAEALTVNASTITRRLRTLEDWTGAALVARKGNATVLTDEGQRFHEQVAPHIEGIAAAALTLSEPGRDDQIRIWCAPGFAARYLMPRLHRFCDANPAVVIDLRPEDATPNFSRHEADVAIRHIPAYGRPERTPASARGLALTRQRIFPVAAPAYLSQAAPINAPADLLDHPLIEEGRTDAWRFWFALFGLRPPEEARGPQLWQPDLTLDAARRGYGIALTSAILARDDLAAGRLVEVAGATRPFTASLAGTYVMMARPDRWNCRPVGRFRHWLTETLRAELSTTASVA